MDVATRERPTESVNPPGRPQRVRCACQSCGAHTYAVSWLRLYGRCGNCKSVDLVPLDVPGEPLRLGFPGQPLGGLG